MQSLTATAQAACDRASGCRARRSELAARRPFGPDDVARARAALVAAIGRASRAHQKLERARRRYAPPSVRAASAPGQPAPDVVPVRHRQPAELRELCAGVGFDRLFYAYLGLGGRCDELELDAFLHCAIDLPDTELAMLSHTLWELTEL